MKVTKEEHHPIVDERKQIYFAIKQTQGLLRSLHCVVLQMGIFVKKKF